MEALAQEIENYQMVSVTSPQRQAMVVRRVAEDRVASMEYGIEQWEEPDADIVLTENAARALAPQRYRPPGVPTNRTARRLGL